MSFPDNFLYHGECYSTGSNKSACRGYSYVFELIRFFAHTMLAQIMFVFFGQIGSAFLTGSLFHCYSPFSRSTVLEQGREIIFPLMPFSFSDQ